MASLLGLAISFAAPLPPMPGVTITGTVSKLKWIPGKSVPGIPGASGSLGKNRVFPARLEVTLRDYSGPSAEEARRLNNFLGQGGGLLPGRREAPSRLVVWIPANDRGKLGVGMSVRIVNYSVRGDEGGTWTSCDRVERLD